MVAIAGSIPFSLLAIHLLLYCLNQTVAPGATESPMAAHFMERDPDAAKNAVDPVPQKRLGQPEEAANIVAFLLGEEAAYINGAVVPIDGGYTAI
ncbi:SDR family oxidoreductase [Gracilibacillus xinjiangensis]|uniref:Peroxisomal trans-2-enoyl-CoA reductase n=1 Tax=Gracilibacillus xinjiangensis TaxID=1193282 RepID=A0ABV8WTA6_9BACI